MAKMTITEDDMKTLELLKKELEETCSKKLYDFQSESPSPKIGEQLYDYLDDDGYHWHARYLGNDKVQVTCTVPVEPYVLNLD